MEPRREPTREDMSLTEPVALSDDVVLVRRDSEPGALKNFNKISYLIRVKNRGFEKML